MAEKRQSDEEHTEAMNSCLKNSGWDVEASVDGLYTFDNQSEADGRAFREALSDCGDKYRDPTVPSREEVEVLYAHALDTASCLRAAGYEVSDPPSKDAYVEHVLGRSPDTWVPFQDAIDRTKFVDMAEYLDLFLRCPQDGPTASLSF